VNQFQSTCLGVALVLGSVALPAAAQEAPLRDGRGPAARAGRGDATPPSPEQRMLTSMQSLMSSDEAEWAVLLPRIQQIQTLIKQRERFAKAKPPPPPRPARRDNEPPPPKEEEQRDPRLIVDIKPDPHAAEAKGTATAAAGERYADLAKAASYEASANELAADLRAFREARAAADAELARAREQLRQLVTSRQEVILVVMGILD
jgi:hypothetical protein